MISKNVYHNVIYYNMILYRVWKWHCRISIRLWTHNGQAMECLLMVWYLGWKWFSSQGLTVITLMCETMRMHIIIYKYVYLLGIKDVALHFMQIFAKPTTRLEVHHCFVFGLVIGHFHCTILKKNRVSDWLHVLGRRISIGYDQNQGVVVWKQNVSTMGGMDINGSVQDCSISIAYALKILLSCTKTSTYWQAYWWKGEQSYDVSNAQINGLMQNRHNSTANALELCLFCIKPSTWTWWCTPRHKDDSNKLGIGFFALINGEMCLSALNQSCTFITFICRQEHRPF